MTNIEIRHLKYLIAVAEELHFGRAAKRLNISQPPLSQQIKQLEKQLGFKLFYRTNRSVALTEAGNIFYKKALRILKDLDIAVEEAESIAKGISGELKIGFSGTFIFNTLPEIINICSQSYPGISLQLSQLTTSEQVKALENNTIDLGFLVAPIKSDVIGTEVIKEEKFIVCLPEHHPLAQCDEIDIKDLQEEKFILTPRESGRAYYDSINRIFKDAGFTPNISQTANEQLTMIALVSAGLGIVIVPDAMRAVHIKGITYRPLNKVYKNTYTIAWNTEYTRPIVTQFLNKIKIYKDAKNNNNLP